MFMTEACQTVRLLRYFRPGGDAPATRPPPSRNAKRFADFIDFIDFIDEVGEPSREFGASSAS
ncbi:hypothetical protein ABZ926_04665 [Streptomyces litmocidini]|uniref:hypothetical protein n=1 Tax=Streptomyces litmocidini TaxID=67318 RepID=UPI0033D6F73A